MPRNEYILRNNGNRSESIPLNFFGTKFRCRPYKQRLLKLIQMTMLHAIINELCAPLQMFQSLIKVFAIAKVMYCVLYIGVVKTNSNILSDITFTGTHQQSWQRIFSKNHLKVLTNEKRGGLTEVSFDSSGFKLFSLWFSNKSVQAPSCERHKTAQRTLFLLFANNNCFPKSDEKLLALFEFRRFF